MTPAVALLTLCVAAEEPKQRLDHRGALGVLGLSGARYASQVSGGMAVEEGFRVPVDVGVSLAPFGSSNELQLWGRGAFVNGRPGWGVLALYRGFFGEERWKTFVDVGLNAVVKPLFSIGPRVGFGVMCEIVPELGVYAAAGAEIGGGNGFRFAADLGLGFQLRTYVLD